MREAGLTPQLVVDTGYSAEAGLRAMRTLLAQGDDRPSAVFGANDMLAIGAMQAARDAGLAIPDDIAIVGFDDIPTANLLGLTTVRQSEFRARRLGGADLDGAPAAGRNEARRQGSRARVRDRRALVGLKGERRMTVLPHDYAERVYAGVLGKLIGVYLGRPFEGWTYERILRELGPINYYVHDRRDVALRNHQLVVTDDDIAGTFAFPRALADNDYPPDLSAEQIGEAWLNYVVEKKSIFWWGGIGSSTEHTAFLRLKSGIPAPSSGSIELNGRTVAEQIGAQIFIDGWAMVSPGNPVQAARLAEQAARVSHDGEAVHAARLLAAMEAQAFIENDVQKLLETGLSFVPADSLIRRVVEQVRDWHAGDNGQDWHRTRTLIAENYGYDKFPGNCHVIPNHALIILALLYGRNSFQEAMHIVNTAGWDTDCNAGNVGCLLSIKDGLAGLDAGPDWRTPIADRLYISSADGGAAITDAVIETRALLVAGHKLAGEVVPAAPKGGARFSFAFPGSLQGFRCEDEAPALLHPVTLENVPGHSRRGDRSLAITFRRLAPGRVARVSTPTFFGQDELGMPTYQLLACPTLYSGQTVECGLEADIANGGALSVRLQASVFSDKDQLVKIRSEPRVLAPGGACTLTWRLPDTAGYPIFAIGLEIEGRSPGGIDGAVHLRLCALERRTRGHLPAARCAEARCGSMRGSTM